MVGDPSTVKIEHREHFLDTKDQGRKDRDHGPKVKDHGRGCTENGVGRADQGPDSEHFE
jgi:hypothetical protein